MTIENGSLYQSPSEKLGYKVGDTFEVISDEGAIFGKGSIIELERDDKSIAPLFKLAQGTCHYRHSNSGTAPGAYLNLEKVKKLS